VLDNGADANFVGPCGWTPLHWAVHAHQPESVRFLASAGANSEKRYNYLLQRLEHDTQMKTGKCSLRLFHIFRSVSGHTPLHRAAIIGDAEMIKILVKECKADVRQRAAEKSVSIFPFLESHKCSLSHHILFTAFLPWHTPKKSHILACFHCLRHSNPSTAAFCEQMLFLVFRTRAKTACSLHQTCLVARYPTLQTKNVPFPLTHHPKPHIMTLNFMCGSMRHRLERQLYISPVCSDTRMLLIPCCSVGQTCFLQTVKAQHPGKELKLLACWKWRNF
jgi:hypothetical protein